MTEDKNGKREKPKRKVASRSFVDRMTSAEAEPDALDREREEARRREEAEERRNSRGGDKS